MLGQVSRLRLPVARLTRVKPVGSDEPMLSSARSPCSGSNRRPVTGTRSRMRPVRGSRSISLWPVLSHSPEAVSLPGVPHGTPTARRAPGTSRNVQPPPWGQVSTQVRVEPKAGVVYSWRGTGWYSEARQRSDRLAIDVEDERRTAIVTHHETQMRRADKRRTRKYWQRPSRTRADQRASPEHDHHAQNNRTASRTRVHEQRIPDHIVSLRRTAPLVRPSFATTCRRQPTAISRCC